MHLKAIHLRNWKGYRRARLAFPPLTPGQNVVICEGYNGAGKTSLMEAIQLCLFGRGGLGIVARASEGGRPESSYDAFLERALNATSRGRPERMSVSLEFEDGDDRLSLERIWYFSGSGRHRAGDEEVRVLAGADLDVLPLPEGPEADAFVRDLVARELLPRDLAPFFLLDGEHLDRMAGKGLDEQVKSAVEAVLGAPALKALAADLRAYARERRKQLPEGTDGLAAEATEALVGLETGERAAAAEVEALVKALHPLRAERDEIVKRIGSLHGDSYASFKALFEERENVARSRDIQQDELRRLLSGGLALALSGPTLRRRAVERIAAEDKAERWESGSETSRNKFGDFVAAVRRQTPQLDERLVPALRRAWDEIWSERPEGCAVEMRFPFLGEADRRSVTQHLDRLSSVKSESIADLARSVAAADARIEEIEREIARQRGLDGESQCLADDLRAVQERIATVEAAHRAAVADLEWVRAKVAEKRREADTLMSVALDSAPILTRASRADRFADLAERLIEEALPANLEALSRAMTIAYRAMAHKSVVQQVAIAPNGAVQLLDGGGVDLRGRDASAGESQIFALSIMSALAGLAGRFPIIMDTPLARLDPVHRKNVLDHFSALDRQLILLTHPAEMGEQELKSLGDRVAGTILIGGAPEEVSPTTLQHAASS
jgi:DNA sulfur modification protein DndD